MIVDSVQVSSLAICRSYSTGLAEFAAPRYIVTEQIVYLECVSNLMAHHLGPNCAISPISSVTRNNAAPTIQITAPLCHTRHFVYPT